MYSVNFLGRCFNFKIFHIYVQTQKSPKNVKKSTRRVAGVLWTPLDGVRSNDRGGSREIEPYYTKSAKLLYLSQSLYLSAV